MGKFVATVALAVAFVAGGFLGTSAKASTFFWAYGGASVSGSGTFTGTFVGGDQYNLTGITGSETDVSGTFPITGLSPYAGADNQLFFPSAPHVSFAGISFSSLGGSDWNIFWNGFYALLTSSDNPVGNADPNVPVDFIVTASEATATPLPATWLMLLSGFLGLGFVAYRGTKKNAAALAAA